MYIRATPWVGVFAAFRAHKGDEVLLLLADEGFDLLSDPRLNALFDKCRVHQIPRNL